MLRPAQRAQIRSRRSLTIPDVDIYLCWCLFAVHKVVTGQMDYLEHLKFPLARELWEIIARTLRYVTLSKHKGDNTDTYLRRAINLLANDQPAAQLLSSMIQPPGDHVADTGSSVGYINMC